MLGNTEHAEGWDGGPDDEIAFVAEWQFQDIGVLAVRDREEDCVVCTGFAGLVGPRAEDHTERIRRLMPCSILLRCVELVGVYAPETWQLERIGQVGGCKAVA